MFQVVLVAPEIPPNTGNVIRLCANTGAKLHLIEPLGFSLAEPAVRRSGMDYAELASVSIHASWEDCRVALGPVRYYAMTTRATRRHVSAEFQAGDALIFGAESRGLPAQVLADIPDDQRLRLPLMPGNRSLNLSNTVAIMVYEAWRQHDFLNGQ